MTCAVRVLVAAAGGVALAAPAPAAAVPAGQPLVHVLRDHVARTAPSPDARRIETVRARRPLTGARTVLPVLATAGGDARRWLRVRLPGRPNGHAGWIAATHTRAGDTGWHLVLRRSRRQVVVYSYGRVHRRFRAVVGARSTPTPTGRFFVEEAVALATGEPGGPFALALSARSRVLKQFNGGPGQIAFHGTRGLAGSPGSAVSHGCIRLRTPAITWLAGHIGAGVPVTVTR